MKQNRRPHSKDLRKGRISEGGRLYLLTTVTRDRLPLFRDFRLGRIVVHSFRYHHEKGMVSSLAFVVMPDHVHWLAELKSDNGLEGLMRSFKSYTSLMMNRVRGTSGQPVWQAGYHDHALRREEDLQDVAKYVVANPLRAGLVERLEDYPLWDAMWL
jgi:REP element-mobilizing transposase RayT